MATPLLEAAVASGQFERVTIGVRAHLAEVLAGGPLEGHVRRLERGKSEKSLLSELGADAALLLSNSLGAAWRAFRARIPLRAGAALSGRGLLLTHRVIPPRRDGRRVPIPTAHLQADVAGLFGILPSSLRPRLFVDHAAGLAARDRLGRLGLPGDARYVLCTPSAAFGAAKLWPAAHHGRALDLLFERLGLRAVVSGAPGEEPVMQAVVRATRHGAIDLSGEPRDLGLLKALVAGSALLLTSDSGPRWFAAAFGIPCVTLMGPNFPELTASSLERCEIVRLEGLECSPCLERVCPLGHHRCMRELAPERAVLAAERLLTAGP